MKKLVIGLVALAGVAVGAYLMAKKFLNDKDFIEEVDEFENPLPFDVNDFYTDPPEDEA